MQQTSERHQPIASGTTTAGMEQPVLEQSITNVTTFHWPPSGRYTALILSCSNVFQYNKMHSRRGSCDGCLARSTQGTRAVGLHLLGSRSTFQYCRAFVSKHTNTVCWYRIIQRTRDVGCIIRPVDCCLSSSDVVP